MACDLLPEPFAGWFASRGWAPHPHQIALLARAADPATLLIAPTGGGKTLAGFLPSLVELGARPEPGLHTLYVSPLKALAADIRRNLGAPLAEMDLTIRVEDRTGDTGAAQRARQRVDPPHILLTTPESLALMLSYEEAPRIFAGLGRVILDEIHALAESKRGDQLMLGLARLQALAPGMRRVGLSATVEDPPALARFLGDGTRVLVADPGPEPDITILETEEPPPWAGQTSTYAARAVMDLIRAARTTLVFINTRAQSELFFQALWAENSEGLPIGLHHGSISREARTRVEAAMAAGQLRGIVATGSLDLGIDWGDVDLVIQVGAPKNVKRLVQRIGRANHRYNAPSRAVLVPANRSKCWNAAPPWRRSTPMTSTASRAAPARSTFSASISCSPPARARSRRTRSSRKSALPARTVPSLAQTSTPVSTSAPPAATRSAPTTAGNGWSRAAAAGACATRGGRGRSG